MCSATAGAAAFAFPAEVAAAAEEEAAAEALPYGAIPLRRLRSCATSAVVMGVSKLVRIAARASSISVWVSSRSETSLSVTLIIKPVPLLPSAIVSGSVAGSFISARLPLTVSICFLASVSTTSAR